MDLGKAKLPRTGLNTLQQAIHPVHGIAWTDGKQVCLTSFQSSDDDAAEPMFGDTNVVGQFEHVLGLRWGPLCCAGSGSPALLAVQHKKHVTVWQLQRRENKLLCTQTCEASEPFPLLAQGCVWHPETDVLALLTKRDASVLFSMRAGDPQRVRAEIRASGLIHCACWTGDGSRLVVAVGTALHSYVWNDTQRTLTACRFCPMFDVGGYVCALEPVGGDAAQVAAATELPLDKICGLNAGMAFDLPPPEPSPSLSHQSGTDLCRRSVDLHQVPLLMPGHRSPLPSGPVDLTHILSRHRRSDPSPLIHLHRRDMLTGSGRDSSHLIIVTYQHKVTTSRKLSIAGILVPDIIALDPSGSSVAVASNTCSVVLVYMVSTATTPTNPQQICLEKNERPKGIRFLSDRRLLLMIGMQKSGDSAFLPSSSNTDKYQLHLLTKDLDYDEASSQRPAQNPHYPSFSYPGARRYSESVSFKEERFGGVTELLLPGGALAPSLGGRRLIKEVGNEESSPTMSLTDFSDPVASSTSSIIVETLRAEPSRGDCGSPRFEPLDPPLPRPGEQIAQNTEQIFARFAEMQRCLSEIQDFAQNGRKSLGCHYPSRKEPPYITVSCKKQVSDSVSVEDRRSVLLCEGKLCLSVLKDLFNMQVLEMQHGSLWIVLVADADGFVPLTFKPKEELTVRNGKRKLPTIPGSGYTPQSDSPSSDSPS